MTLPQAMVRRSLLAGFLPPRLACLILAGSVALPATGSVLLKALEADNRIFCDFGVFPTRNISSPYDRVNYPGLSLAGDGTADARGTVGIFPGPHGLVDADLAYLYVVEEFAWVTSLGPHTTPLQEDHIKQPLDTD